MSLSIFLLRILLVFLLSFFVFLLRLLILLPEIDLLQFSCFVFFCCYDKNLSSLVLSVPILVLSLEGVQSVSRFLRHFDFFVFLFFSPPDNRWLYFGGWVDGLVGGWTDGRMGGWVSRGGGAYFLGAIVLSVER